MGLYDNVTIHRTLPWPEVQAHVWHSKHTPLQYLADYEIRADGTLFLREADLCGADLRGVDLRGADWLGRETDKWVPMTGYNGELECHTTIAHDDRPGGWWYSVQFWMRDGVVADAVYAKLDTRPVTKEASDGTGTKH